MDFLSLGMTVTTVEEEKLYNPRLNKSKEEFIEIMKNLCLSQPKKIGKGKKAECKTCVLIIL